ncbi:acyl-CoA dehydrogenase family protein [Oceanibacterium hippocampi]|uniref:Glutaryl-CoA dehydrogenase n=1 Tax=Oceanibacterium hippocampi TaxID=745714 RepID=A0A1Y5TW82_9PROT|nr:acyl-CoA dehydrogenase family protein [Oceanibacterium hippocampi]SLN71387.1 Glutaryl-CoA dehydrogenase [Oceanibacterium hippocampi]
MQQFDTDERQTLILDTVDKFMARHMPPEEARRRDEGHVPPYDLLPLMGEAGFFGLPIPEAYGGTALDWYTVSLVQERLAYHAYAVGSIFNRVVGFGAMSLLRYGSDAQKADLLPRIVEGRCLIALALTESQAGSDAGAIRTRAVRTDGGWVIDGSKTWISDADGADYLLIAARTDPGSEGPKGISMLLVPRGQDGIAMTPIPKVGNNCMPSWEIALDGVFVPDSALMGEEGRGFGHLMSTLHYSRASMAATVTGCAQAAVDLAISHARERQQFGRPIGKFQVIRHRIADMQMRVDATRLVVRNLAWLISQDRDTRRLASQAKVQATESLQFVTEHGMQILASAGYAAESAMQRYWRDARLYSFGEGSNEIQRDIIAKELGL